MIVVSDTSSISALIHIERVEILRTLYDTVVIPTAVRDELYRGHAQIPGFLEIQEPQDATTVSRLMQRVDPGEAQAIALAHELKADFLLIDEKLGRAVAQERGVRVVGLLGVLSVAKSRGLIDSLRQVVEELETKARFRISEAVKQAAFAHCGEA